MGNTPQTDAKALRAIASQLQTATRRITKLHNRTNNVALLRSLNEVNPDIIALTDKILDRLRSLEQSA